jgi:large subunit ribosomal protein L21
MYAVMTTGGKQYRVEAGSTLVVEKLAGEPGSSVTFDRVLLVGDGETVTVGTPTVEGASVRATVLGEELGPKIVVFKFKQKVKYRRRTGHRQHLTRLHIDAISADGKTVTAEEPTPKKAGRSKPATRAAAKKATSAAEPAEAPAKKPARPSRARAASTAGEPADTEAAAATSEKKPRTRARATSGAKASSAPAEDAPKPRARRSAKPKAEPAKEE